MIIFKIVSDQDWTEFYVFFNLIQLNLIGLNSSFIFCQSKPTQFNFNWIELE